MESNAVRNIIFFIFRACVFILFLWTNMPGQSDLKNFVRIDSNTTEAGRVKFKKNLYENIIRKNLSFTLSDKNEKKWKGAYWGCEISYFRDTLVKNCLLEALRQYKERSPEFDRATLEAVFTLYPSGFEKEIRRIMEVTYNSKHFAMAAEYLLRQSTGSSADSKKLLVRKFPMWQKDPVLIMLNYRLGKIKKRVPQITDLLRNGFWNKKTVIFSFQSKNRDYEGITLIRKPDGKFLRDSSGQIFHIDHLARSVSNLPGYLTNGNTPEGIYSVQKIDTSDNIFIGKTPLIVTALPYEISPDEFFKDNKLKGTQWTRDLYRKLLPATWLDYFPVYEAFYAGMAGRTEIVMHGTTIDPGFYRNSSYYPNTPSMGCMTAKEIYSPEDGRLILSDQQKLISAFMSCCRNEAFLVVVNIGEKERNLHISDILSFIQKSE